MGKLILIHQQKQSISNYKIIRLQQEFIKLHFQFPLIEIRDCHESSANQCSKPQRHWNYQIAQIFRNNSLVANNILKARFKLLSF